MAHTDLHAESSSGALIGASEAGTSTTPAGTRPRPRGALLLLLAAPLLWVPLTFLHPAGEPYAGIAGETDRWLFVHVGQLVLTPFLAAGVWILLGGMRSVAALIARAALVLWVVFFSAFDAVAGIATGVLARHANSLTGDDRAGIAAAVDFLFDDSQLVGGGFSVLGNLGHGAWVVLAIAMAVALHRARAPRAAVVAAATSVLFAAHSGFPAAVGLIALFTAELVVLRRAAPDTAPGVRDERVTDERRDEGELAPA